MKRDKVASVSIILPCIGGDEHFKPPFSKELMMMSEDMSVIDSSFRHILSSRFFKLAKPRVIVIIESNKSDTVRYLSKKYGDKVDLVFIFQKSVRSVHAGRSDHADTMSAVRSVEHLFGDKNILLMPNIIIEDKDKKIPLIDRMLDALEGQPFAFICKEEASVSRLKLSGALNIKDGKIVDYQHQPAKNFEKYNAFWVSFGFRKEIFDEAASVLEKGTLKNQKSAIYKSSPVMVTQCDNISTWTNLNAYLLKQYLIKSGVDPQFIKIYQ